MALSKEEKERRKLLRRQKKWEETHKIIDGIDHKFCSKCNDYHPATIEYFYANKKNSIDGLHPYCIEKAIEQATTWINNNYDKFLEVMRKRDLKPEVRDRKRAATKISRENGTQKEWRQNNRDKLSVYNKHRRENKTHEISLKQWDACRLYFDYRCAYCGVTWEEHYNSVGHDLHKEHVSHFGENDLSNCVPACRSCNSQKWEFPLDEWYNNSNLVYLESRYNRIMQWVNEDHKKHT